ncbi:hypothetical protein cce_2030 [Crocosphaera subtropica ATCC 51142]|uniref:Putative restriction endonuclease domain-containing protein n=1 Tax=Crocosphaera subtropica (strain ATCC 51142 / BH68) TaxID=43989 RepID=B1X1F1_CROS5|nr:Uma2 family endonuclease [Crocosphaera subtropica]ACB51380.1 hypothetical protein cce_2030 [Crocosphaera subtropica ATCC 51142]
MEAGIEPDECFYIKNYQAVIGKNRLDLTQDPPPDLALEYDLTSLTEITAYQKLRVPELWVYYQSELTIYILKEKEYQKSSVSLNFPDVKIIEAIPKLIEKASLVGNSQALWEFEESLRNNE